MKRAYCSKCGKFRSTEANPSCDRGGYCKWEDLEGQISSYFEGPSYAICRHYQFADLHNGSWYIEIVGKGLQCYLLREVRNRVVQRQKEYKTFGEARKVFWDRTVKMSQEAGLMSLPPELPKIVWENDTTGMATQVLRDVRAWFARRRRP